jgi:hypothetical protein
VLSATLSALASSGGFRPSVSSLCQELVAVAVPASEVVQWATAVIAATPGSDKAAPTMVSSQVTVLEVLRCELIAEHNAGRLKEMRLANLLPGLLTAAASPHKVTRLHPVSSFLKQRGRCSGVFYDLLILGTNNYLLV